MQEFTKEFTEEFTEEDKALVHKLTADVSEDLHSKLEDIEDDYSESMATMVTMNVGLELVIISLLRFNDPESLEGMLLGQMAIIAENVGLGSSDCEAERLIKKLKKEIKKLKKETKK